MEGGCLCGAVRYRIDDPPRRATHCHCGNCRRAGGAPFVTWVVVARAGFRFVQGKPAAWESRPGVWRAFCGGCGSQLTYQRDDEPATLDVTAGTLDDVASVTPEDHIWCDRMVPWVKIDDGLPRYVGPRSRG